MTWLREASMATPDSKIGLDDEDRLRERKLDWDLRIHQPKDWDAEALKIARLRKLRLAAEGKPRARR
jgi:hypothetical protein